MYAGRNLSATHIAFASTRVMATCSAVGQGVGTAAAYAIQKEKDPQSLPSDADATFRIRQQLLRDDAMLLGCQNEDPQDLAPKATVTASSEQPEGPATAVIDGWTRSLRSPSVDRSKSPIGAPPDRFPEATHRWMSDPALGLPAWIALSWNEPITIGIIALVFDTGMHRLLTLSMADGYTGRMLWGRPQPETIRDYAIEANVEGQWITIHSEQSNYQRKQVHPFKNPIETSSIRFQIFNTNGIDHARLFEIRVYPPDVCDPFLP
jgi:hypothetical protein